MRADGWIAVKAMPPDTMAFYGGVVNRAKFTNPAPECDSVEAVFDELAMAAWFSGNDSTRYAAYYAIQTTTGVVAGLVIDRPTMGVGHAFALEVLLHEAAHHAGYGHTGPFTAYMAEKCAVLGPPLEEEDDPACGDGADCGGGGTPEPVCTETQEWIPPVTMEVWVKPESTMGESGPPVDLDHEVGAYLPGIVVNVESGYWAEVVIADGYWRTVTTCTES